MKQKMIVTCCTCGLSHLEGECPKMRRTNLYSPGSVSIVAERIRAGAGTGELQHVSAVERALIDRISEYQALSLRMTVDMNAIILECDRLHAECVALTQENQRLAGKANDG